LKQATKHRIVGTVVLLALALIFLPILFDGQGSYQATISSRIPTPPAVSLLPEPNQTRPTIIAETDAILISPATADQPVSSEALSVADAGSQNTANSLEEDAEQGVQVSTSEPAFIRGEVSLDTSGLPRGWSVRLGSFSDVDNATKLMENLQIGGYKAYTRSLSSSQGQLTGVFVGPWLDRSRVDGYIQRLQAEYQLTGMVVPYEVEQL